MLTPTEAHGVLSRLADSARRSIPNAWSAGAELMLGWDGRTWLMMDDLARRWTSRGGPCVAGSAGWLGPDLVEPSGFVAAVTCLHTDGRVRERATRVLAGQTGALSAIALGVRSLDHVREVRAAAADGLRRHVGLGDAEAALPVLVAGVNRRHGIDARGVLLEELLRVATPSEVARRLMDTNDRTTRRWAHQFAHEHGALTTGQLMRLVATDQDQGLRVRAAQWLAPLAGADEFRELLRGRSANGRLLALTEIHEADLDTNALIAALTDPAARVRRIAQWRAGRRGLDVAAVYRVAIADVDATPRAQAAALDALADVGSSADIPAISRHLAGRCVAVRAAATAAVASLADAGSARSFLVPLLLDRSPRVARAAARGLIRANASATDVQAAWAAQDQPWSRQAAWRVMRASSSWSAVVADLNATADEDPTLRKLGTRGLQDWLRTSAASTYRPPTPDQLAVIERLLPTSGLAKHQLEMLAFHARLGSTGSAK